MLKEKYLIPENLQENDKLVEELTEINLDKFILETFESIELENKEEELERFRRWAKNRAFYVGNQRGFWDNKKNKWISVNVDSLPPMEASLLTINNQFRPQVKTLAKEFSRSVTRIRANAKSDSQKSIMASRFSDALIKHHQAKMMTESARQLEAKYMLLCGNSFRYITYSMEKNSVNLDVPLYGKVVLPAYESHICSECGFEYESLPANEKCFECGGYIESTVVESKETFGKTGSIKMNAGDIVCEIVDPVEIKVWAGAMSLEDSPYLRRKRLVKKNFITKTYPFYSPKGNKNISEHAINQYEMFSSTTENKYRKSGNDIYEYDQLWLDPSYYENYRLESDYSFFRKSFHGWDKITLKKGDRLKDHFPDGMYICKIGQDILCLYNENKDEHWEHLPFDISTEGFWAYGLEDCISNQQIVNEFSSLAIENVLYNASPKLIVNPAIINPATLTGRPKDIVLMSDNARKESPRDGIHQLSGMSLTQEVMYGIDAAKRDMREQTGAFLAFNGQGDPYITTATGMSIARDSALALVSIALAIRSEKDLSTAWKILKLTKQHWFDNKYRFLLGKYNESEAKSFKEAKLEEEINLYVEPYSWMPQTNFEKLENLNAYLTAFGMPLGFLNPQIPEAVRIYASQLYNIPLDFDEMYPDRRIAQRRLDTAKEFAEAKIPEVLDSVIKLTATNNQKEAHFILTSTMLILADIMGVEEDIDDHAVFIGEYIKWLKTDEGQNAHPILREAVKQTIADHREFQLMQNAEKAENQMLMYGGEAPILQGSIGKSFQSPESNQFQPSSEIMDYSLNNKKNKL